MTTYDAVILAGGAARRLGGVDKARVEIGGRTLLDRSVAAVAGARTVVVVGDPAPTPRPVRFLRESPRLGGPGAGLLAGWDALGDAGAPRVVLACDLPRVTAATVDRLLAASGDADGAVLTDPQGHWALALALRPGPLAALAPPADERAGLPLYKLLGRLDLAEVAAVGEEHRDVDTWADLDALERP